MSGQAIERAEQRPGLLAAWSPDELDVIRQRIAPGASDAELAHFAQECAHRGLSPFRGEIYGIMRWDSDAGKKVLSPQVSVAGRRTIADRTGLYGGQSAPLWCGPDGQWHEVWLEGGPPAACKVEVFRKDFDQPIVGIARYASYVQVDKNGNPKGLWKTAPDYMLHKTAEAAALRRAFPDEGMRAVADLAPQSRISMDARRLGLDDDARHELVARVTGGRTESTRDLTDDEVIEVRAELAAIEADQADDAPGAPPDVDPETGELVATAVNPLARQITDRIKALDEPTRERLRAWVDEKGIGRVVSGYGTADLYAVADWLNIDESNEEPF